MGRKSGGRGGSLRNWIRCDNQRYFELQRAANDSGSNWSEPMGGCDSAGNPLTVQFGGGQADGETRLGDGDRSEINFRASENHDHYGSGNGPNQNGTRRNQYTGEGR